MKTKYTKIVVISKKELLAILANHFGEKKIDDVEEMTEEYGWSGQVWDDGPQATRFTGLKVTVFEDKRK